MRVRYISSFFCIVLNFFVAHSFGDLGTTLELQKYLEHLKEERIELKFQEITHLMNQLEAQRALGYYQSYPAMHQLDLNQVKLAIVQLIEMRIDDFCKKNFSISHFFGLLTLSCALLVAFSFPIEYFSDSDLKHQFKLSKLFLAPTTVFAPLWYLFHRFEKGEKKLVEQLKSLLIELSNHDYTTSGSRDIINAYFDIIIDEIKAHSSHWIFAKLQETLAWDKKKLNISN